MTKVNTVKAMEGYGDLRISSSGFYNNSTMCMFLFNKCISCEYYATCSIKHQAPAKAFLIGSCHLFNITGSTNRK